MTICISVDPVPQPRTTDDNTATSSTVVSVDSRLPKRIFVSSGAGGHKRKKTKKDKHHHHHHHQKEFVSGTTLTTSGIVKKLGMSLVII